MNATNMIAERNAMAALDRSRKFTRLTDKMLRVNEDLRSAGILISAIERSITDNADMTKEEIDDRATEVLELLEQCIDDISSSVGFITQYPEYSESDLREMCIRNYENYKDMYSMIRRIYMGQAEVSGNAA